MTEISKLNTTQLEQLLNRIERLETKLGVAGSKGRYGNGLCTEDE